MRVLGVLAAWSVLAVLATMCFALGGSIGYRRGVRDTLAQLRERRAGKAGCRPLPANHLHRRSSGQARPGAPARRARWRVGPSVPVHGVTPLAALRSGRWTSAALAGLAAFLLVGVPGTAVGATTAQPGDSLWRVKLGLEQVRLALATGPERDARVHVDLAAVRLGELSGLVGADARLDLVDQVTDGLADHATAASEQLPRVAAAARSELRQRIQAVTSRQVAVMGALVESDCDGSPGPDCMALRKTLEETVALSTATATVAVATPVPADDVARNPESAPTSAAQADEAAGAAPVAETSGEPAAAAGATASSSPDEAAPPKDTSAGDEAEAKPTPASTPSPTPAKTPKPSSSPSPTPTPAPPQPADPDPPQAGSGTATAGGQPRADEDASAEAQP